jgi:tRNA(Ile)-lysidine synthase
MNQAEFEKEVRKFLSPCKTGEVYLAAVSGGADSTALLAALQALRERLGFVLHCIHVNHNIRPPQECREDAAFVEGLCAGWGIPCHVVRIAPGVVEGLARSEGLEAAARVCRMRAFRRCAEKIAAAGVLTAHTADDALENTLMGVLRGAGPGGLSGMPEKAGRIIRPLIGLTRKDVLCYLECRGLPHREDPSNQDTALLRNRVRHRLVPVLDELFPSWRRNLEALAGTQALVRDLLRDEALRRIHWKPCEGGLAAGEAEFFGAPEAVREEALFGAFNIVKSNLRSGLPSPDPPGRQRPPRRRALRVFASGEVRSLDLGRLVLSRGSGQVMVCRKDEGEKGFAAVVRKEGVYAFPGFMVEIKTAKDGRAGPFVFEASCFPLVIRSLRPRDRLPDTAELRALHGRRDIALIEDKDGIAVIFSPQGSWTLLSR